MLVVLAAGTKTAFVSASHLFLRMRPHAGQSACASEYSAHISTAKCRTQIKTETKLIISRKSACC